MDEEMVKEAEDSAESDAERAERLAGELASLKESIENERAENRRMMGEYSEFSELFPDVSLKSVSESVWEDVKKGIPLAAAYALYDRKNELAARCAAAVNERNSRESAGAVKGGGSDEYYSPAEVRAMSHSDVRANFDKIMASMKKWK